MRKVQNRLNSISGKTRENVKGIKIFDPGSTWIAKRNSIIKSLKLP